MKNKSGFTIVEIIIVVYIISILGFCLYSNSKSNGPRSGKLIENDNYENKLRVEITRISVFYDDLAYDGKRGVYLIKDKDTGKEFIGVSGIGISELGSHSSGKAHHSDER